MSYINAKGTLYFYSRPHSQRSQATKHSGWCKRQYQNYRFWPSLVKLRHTINWKTRYQSLFSPRSLSQTPFLLKLWCMELWDSSLRNAYRRIPLQKSIPNGQSLISLPRMVKIQNWSQARYLQLKFALPVGIFNQHHANFWSQKKT